MFRYESLGLFNDGVMGSVHPKYYKHLQNKYGANIECFGSCMNKTYKYYFGIFPDIEENFGCLGNFFTAELESGLFVINPPFTFEILNATTKKIQEQLQKYSDITIVYVSPTWDVYDRNLSNSVCQKKRHITYQNDSVLRELLFN